MLPKLFFISILISSFIFTTHSYNQCLHHQKTLLLQLKNELIFNASVSTKLVQWNERDECCKWYGVECDAAGYVVSLQLDDDAIYGGIGDLSSLFRLKHLEKLNLAYNSFNYTPIPKGIHNLAYLTHLNLSYAGFGGQVPAEMLSLRRLVSLDISNDYRTLSLEFPNLEMLVQNLTGLRELYLDGTSISTDEGRKWSHIISSNLPHITSLSLVDCSLSGPLATSFWKLHSLSILRLDLNDLSSAVPNLFAKFLNLTHLSLFYCSLDGLFPDMIFQIPTLQNLDLSHNERLSGSIPAFAQNGSLKSIRLSNTNFSGFIPSSINNVKTLSEVDLSNCKFTGAIPSTFANLTQLIYVDLSSNFFRGSLSSVLFEGLSSLVHLNLEFNSFSGNIPHSLFSLPLLLRLHLSNNQFIGLVEELSIVNVSNIVRLELSSNQLEGPIPDSFFQLQSLEYLLLSENLFSGTFQLDKIQSLANLRSLDLSRNNLSVDVRNNNSSTYRLPQLEVLRLTTCHLSDFPDFMKHSNIRELDLSNNRIAGEIPSWIWGTKLRDLNLSHNRIVGEIPSWIWGTELVYLDLSFNLLTNLEKPYHIPASLQDLRLQSNQLRGELYLPIPPNTRDGTSNLQYLLLANNNFSGSLPTSLCNAAYLIVLDLSVNKFSGNIPPCLLQNITILNLGQNNIGGHIPDNFSLNCRLKYFDLNNNSLEGEVPKTLESCTELELMNVGNNKINDSFPCMLPSSLRVLVLHSNRFHGEVRCHDSWEDLQILDISSNNFSGSMESTNFSILTAMVLGSDAQLSHNYSGYYSLLSFGVTLTMKGLNIQLDKIWPDFGTIDFSCNNFTGEIPNSIGDLSSLHHLNLSHNALNGSIPKSLGQLGNLESLDLSTNQLRGAIPVELAGITFLSVLNLSYNKFVGVIPTGRQFQTFSADSFEGNSGLCGFPLNISCNRSDDLSPQEDENVEDKREIEWDYVFAALGYVVGLGIIVWLLLFCRSFRDKYFGKIEEVVEEIFGGRSRRRRRARRVIRNQGRRQ